MRYWLFKSEPFKWSWDQQKAKGDVGEEWDGIRNYQARNNMREMKIGDRGFFYHSNEGLDVVGVVEISAESAPDSTTDDERWDCVHVRALADVPNPVKLPDIKANEALSEMALVKNTRLSVQPVLEDEWIEVCRMGGIDPETLKPA
ncbi:MAG: EVE domain-containing protein [Pseudomonadota bacterium]